MKKILVFMVVIPLLIPAMSFAKRVKYEVVEVTNGGTIKGQVKSATKVKDPVYKLSDDTDYCGKTQNALAYILSPDLQIKNVLVIVEDVAKGKAAPKIDLTLDNNKCRFEPLVSISYVKSQYIVKNSDPIFHNTSLAAKLKNRRRTVFNLALPHKDQSIKKKNRISGVMGAKCDAHAWMRAYVYSSRHPYVAVTDKKGNFEIKDLLPGKYTVRFWHEGFKESAKEIEVKAGKASELNVTFTKTIEPAFLKGL